MAGVGKSALAIHVAHQIQSNFSDVQLYANLRGADGVPLESSQVLVGWLRALGFDESSMPSDLEEQSAAYRSQLAGKKALILLDNAHDEAQVRPLLPASSSSAVLITSRRQLTALPGIKLLNLKALFDKDALELLKRLVGSERVECESVAAERIIHLCGLLPLAIRIAGGTLKKRLHWQLEDYANKLSDERRRLERLSLGDLNIRASFDLSYRELVQNEALLFRLLGMLPGNFAGIIGAVLLDSDSEVADATLDQLVDAALLEPLGEELYQFHDLIRLFSREQLGRICKV